MSGMGGKRTLASYASALLIIQPIVAQYTEKDGGIL